MEFQPSKCLQIHLRQQDCMAATSHQPCRCQSVPKRAILLHHEWVRPHASILTIASRLKQYTNHPRQVHLRKQPQLPNVPWRQGHLVRYGLRSASHVFHLHGNSVSWQGATHPAISVNDGVGKTLYMNAVGQGKWQAICHVNNHHALGMVAGKWPKRSKSKG